MNKKIVLSVILAAAVSLSCGAASAFAKTNALASDGASSKAVSSTSKVSSKTVSSATVDLNEKEFKECGFTDADRRNVTAISEKLSAQNVADTDKKNYIYDKMLNTEDFYKTLTGKYQRNYRHLGDSYTVEYKVINGPKHMSFELYKGKQNAQEISYFDSNTIKTFAINNKLKAENSGKGALVRDFVVSSNSDKANFVPLVKSTSRIKKDSSGTNIYYYRPDMNKLYHSRTSIVPQEMTIGYLSDFKTWSITGQETVAGRNCYKIQGTLSGEYAQKLDAYSYTFWVDSETGILLKYKNFGKNGQETDSLETLQISVNPDLQPVELDSAAKQLIPAEYLK